jgi:hypothetical protein
MSTEKLLEHCPKHMREYRKHVTESAKRTVRPTFGAGKARASTQPGRAGARPRAARLHDQGKTWGEVAQRYCTRKSEPGHVCNKLCADRIRLNAAPYLRSK